MTADDMKERNRAWREFAAAALGGLCTAQNQDGEWAHGGPSQTTRSAAEMADAMMEEYFKREL